jgi:predicted GIY-YIG superfamily endonuclease
MSGSAPAEIVNDRIRTWFLYWIVTEDDVQAPLYIGITSSMKRRAIEHKCRLVPRLMTMKPRDNYLLMPVKKLVGNFAAARSAETIEIMFQRDSGHKLANIVTPMVLPNNRVLVSKEFIDIPFSLLQKSKHLAKLRAEAGL